MRVRTPWIVMIAAAAACASPTETVLVTAPAPAPMPAAMGSAAPGSAVTAGSSSDETAADDGDDTADPPRPLDVAFDPAPDVADRCVVSARDHEMKAWTAAAFAQPDWGGGEGVGRTRDALRDRLYTTLPAPAVCDVRRHAALERSITAATRAAGSRAPADQDARWDHQSPLGYHDVVAAALELTPADEAKLAQTGLVVPERLGYDDYASAYYDIHRAQLPVFVTADSVLHAVFVAHDGLLARLEREVLSTRLDRALGAMHCQLAGFAKSLPPDTARDLDLYLAVARDLLSGAATRGEVSPDTAPAAAQLVAKILAGGPIETIELFGRHRAFDATMYIPRGHYAADEQSAAYFRAAMWLSRLELNLVSRDNRSSHPGLIADVSETPREAVDAMALAQLARASGALADLGAIDAAWSAFAGAREDVSLDGLLGVMASAHIGKLAIPASADALRAAIGDRYRRSVNTFPNAEVRNLPVIATVLGPRVTADTIALQALPIEHESADGEAAALGYALGQDRALAYVPARMQRPVLDGARAAMRTAAAAKAGGNDLYGAWLGAILALGDADAPAGARPSVMATPAFADLRLDTALAAYGQLRHANVLVAAQYYAVGGCEIPDGYVEPVPAVYDHLAAWAARGEAAFGKLDPTGAVGGAAYFKRARGVLQTLAAIARDELAGRALTADQKSFLAMVVEERDVTTVGYTGTFPIATYDGWFTDLFPDLDAAFKAADFVADYATHVREDGAWIDYVGAARPAIGVFVVDTGGAPRVMVGPVARGYAAQSDIATRYTDETANRAAPLRPWAASYSEPAAPAPAMTVTVTRADVIKGAPGMWGRAPGIVVEAPAALGDVTIELRDHHFVTIDTIKAHVGAGKTAIALPPATATGFESVLVHVGAFAGRVDLAVSRSGSERFGSTTAGRGSRGSQTGGAP